MNCLILPNRLRPLLLVIGLILLGPISAFAQDAPTKPKIIVQADDPGDFLEGDDLNYGVTAKVDNPPQPLAEHKLVPHWLWKIGTVSYSETLNGKYDAATDGSAFDVKLKPVDDAGSQDDTNPAAVVTGTFNSAGYYQIEVIATVKYVDPDDSANDVTPDAGSAMLGDTQDDETGDLPAPAGSAQQSSNPDPQAPPTVSASGAGASGDETIPKPKRVKVTSPRYTVTAQPPSPNMGHPIGTQDSLKFVVVIEATVTLNPKLPLPSVTFQMDRPAKKGRTDIIVSDSVAGIPITHPDKSLPKQLFIFRSHPDPKTLGDPPLFGHPDWDITKLAGRWNIKVKNKNSNTVSYKIDKRKQIATTASSWVGVAQSYQGGTGHGGLYCNEFAAYIYGYLGLTLGGSGLGVSACFTSAPVTDGGIGSLDFFGDVDNKGYLGHVQYGHVGIITVVGSQNNPTIIVDENCPKADSIVDSHSDQDPLSSANTHHFTQGPISHATDELKALDAE